LKLDGRRLSDLSRLQKRLGYNFKDIGLLDAALTHSSYANEKSLPKDRYNERLEFLGDAVLEMITSEFLYKEFDKHPEGALTKMRAALVREQALEYYAQQLGLGVFLQIGRGEEQSGGRKRASILADAFEAVVGAVYLDGGYVPARVFVEKYIKNRAPKLTGQSIAGDYKTVLQERIQAEGGKPADYRLVAQEGPDHDRTFRVNVYIDDRVYGEGTGKSKKEAEQNAAKKALEKLEG
jgi:ribonuclease-3